MTAWPVECHKPVADIDVNVIHVRICHGATRAVIGDEPLNQLTLPAWNAQIDRSSGRMLGGTPRGGDSGAGPTGRNNLHISKTRFDAAEKCARVGRQTRGAGRCTAALRALGGLSRVFF